MRPLSQEETKRLRHHAGRNWRRSCIAVFVFTALLVCTVPIVASGENWWRNLLGGALAGSWLISLMCAGREWKRCRRLEVDLAAGEADQVVGTVWDPIRPTSFVAPKTYLVRAQDRDVELNRSQLKAIAVGDQVAVDYLPRTQIVLEVRKLSSA